MMTAANSSILPNVSESNVFLITMLNRRLCDCDWPQRQAKHPSQARAAAAAKGREGKGRFSGAKLDQIVGSFSSE